MRRTISAAHALAFSLLLSASPALAYEPPSGLEIRRFQRFTLYSPFSGPVETIVMTNHTTISQGGLMDVFVAVQNHSNDSTVGVLIDLDLSYVDGVQVRPFNLGTERTQTLGPDEGVGFFIFWQIPANAPLGTATFTVNARVTRLTGGSDRHDDNVNPMIATDSVTFEVVP